MVAGMVWESSPFGPRTTMWPSCCRSSTPPGSGTGFLPIRDTLPDLRQELAAQTTASSLMPAHDPHGSGDNNRSQARANSGNGRMPGVSSQAGSADALDSGNDRYPVGGVLEDDTDVGILLFRDAEVLDETLILEDLCDRELHPGVRELRRGIASNGRIPNASQHIGDGVSRFHVCSRITSWPW